MSTRDNLAEGCADYLYNEINDIARGAFKKSTDGQSCEPVPQPVYADFSHPMSTVVLLSLIS